MQEGPRQEARSQTIRQLGFTQKAKWRSVSSGISRWGAWAENRCSRTHRQSKDHMSGGGSDKALSEATTAYAPVGLRQNLIHP